MSGTIGIIAELMSGIFEPAAKLIDSVHTSDEERLLAQAKLAEIKNRSLNKALTLESKIIEANKAVIMAEAKGESWLQRNWRPILMLVVIAIIANNFIIAPYLSLFTSKVVVLELPGALYGLLTAGVGGYIVGRSGEKIAAVLKKGE